MWKWFLKSLDPAMFFEFVPLRESGSCLEFEQTSLM